MKRATSDAMEVDILLKISIHALVKRATPKGKFATEGQKISIHALVKRATEIIDKAYIYKNDFNPRPREEGD